MRVLAGVFVTLLLAGCVSQPLKNPRDVVGMDVQATRKHCIYLLKGPRVEYTAQGESAVYECGQGVGLPKFYFYTLGGRVVEVTSNY